MVRNYNWHQRCTVHTIILSRYRKKWNDVAYFKAETNKRENTIYTFVWKSRRCFRGSTRSLQWCLGVFGRVLICYLMFAVRCGLSFCGTITISPKSASPLSSQFIGAGIFLLCFIGGRMSVGRRWSIWRSKMYPSQGVQIFVWLHPAPIGFLLTIYLACSRASNLNCHIAVAWVWDA